MEQIPNCFAKFFLSQVVEIEPETIQIVIDNGYESKVTLLCLDLIHDLPRIEGISLAQQSLIRKYVGALQQYCPFNVYIDQDALNKHNEYNMPSKKRKYDDVYEHESNLDTNGGLSRKLSRNDLQPNKSSVESENKVTSPLFKFNDNHPSPKVTIKQSPVKIISSQESSDAYIDIVEPETEKPLKDGPSVESASQQSRRGRKSVKKPIELTKSQILYQQRKEMNDNKSMDTSQLLNSTLVDKTSRRTSCRKSTDHGFSSASISTSTGITNRVPTAAELEIRARIEEKKAKAQSATKPRVSRKRY
ncbi:hypothetical protein BLOT_003086 [Blomia tropicalis]|nr:hypothetical protein BLOT_003086 [Blomia tropicalis]